MPPKQAFVLLLFVGGCASEQPWEFRNGFGLDEPPARIVAQVHRGGDCGFACRPPGDPLYCADLESDARGPAPTGLADGERFCFSGTAYDAAGRTIGVGCEVATTGAGPITVTLSPSDESRQAACGAGLDAGLGSRDAGRIVDAGPGLDAADPGPHILTVESSGNGGFFVENINSGRGWIVDSEGRRGVRFDLRVSSGNTYQIHPDPDRGYRFDIYDGGGCDVFVPCEVTVTRDVTIEVAYARE